MMCFIRLWRSIMVTNAQNKERKLFLANCLFYIFGYLSQNLLLFSIKTYTYCSQHCTTLSCENLSLMFEGYKAYIGRLD